MKKNGRLLSSGLVVLSILANATIGYAQSDDSSLNQQIHRDQAVQEKFRKSVISMPPEAHVLIPDEVSTARWRVMRMSKYAEDFKAKSGIFSEYFTASDTNKYSFHEALFWLSNKAAKADTLSPGGGNKLRGDSVSSLDKNLLKLIGYSPVIEEAKKRKYSAPVMSKLSRAAADGQSELTNANKKGHDAMSKAASDGQRELAEAARKGQQALAEASKIGEKKKEEARKVGEQIYNEAYERAKTLDRATAAAELAAAIKKKNELIRGADAQAKVLWDQAYKQKEADWNAAYNKKEAAWNAAYAQKEESWNEAYAKKELLWDATYQANQEEISLEHDLVRSVVEREAEAAQAALADPSLYK